MINEKDRKSSQFRDKEEESSKSIFNWIAQYDEEDDFLSGKVSNSLPESTQED